MKISVLVTAVLLIVPVLCVVSTEESDGATANMEDVLICEVYKVDVSMRPPYSPSSYVDHMIFFERDDVIGKNEFERALRNHETLPLSNQISWPYSGKLDLTVYVFGYIPQDFIYDGHSRMYILWWDENEIMNEIYILEEDRITDAVPRIKIPSGQTVTITVRDIPGEADLVFSHEDGWNPPVLSKGINKIDIIDRGDYVLYGTGWDYSQPYVSYSIEYEDRVPDASVYGYAFAAAGAACAGIMIAFGLPQRIKDR